MPRQRLVFASLIASVLSGSMTSCTLGLVSNEEQILDSGFARFQQCTMCSESGPMYIVYLCRASENPDCEDLFQGGESSRKIGAIMTHRQQKSLFGNVHQKFSIRLHAFSWVCKPVDCRFIFLIVQEQRGPMALILALSLRSFASDIHRHYCLPEYKRGSFRILPVDG